MRRSAIGLLLFFVLGLPALSQAEEMQTPTFGSLAGRLTEQGLQLDHSLGTALQQMDAKLREKAGTWPKAANAAEAKKVKEALQKAWTAESEDVTSTLNGELLTGDDATLKAFGASTDLEGKLARQLRASRDKMVDDKEGIPADLAKGLDSLKNLSTELTGEQALAKVGETLDSVRTAATKHLSGLVTERTRALVPLFANDTSAASAQAKLSETQAKEEEKDTFLKQFSSPTGLSKVVRCSWTDAQNSLHCLPDGLLLAADDISEIRIQDLPPGKWVKVRALSVAPSSGKRSKKKPKGKEAQNAAELEAADDDTQNLAYSSCAEEAVLQIRLSCDQLTFSTNDRTAIVIAIFKGRLLAPSYGGFKSNFEYAYRVLRGTRPEDPPRTNRPKMSLLISGRTPEILLDVQILGDAPLDSNDEEPPANATVAASAETVRSASIPVAYKQWSFETGAFFAFTSLTDQELVKENIPAVAATATEAAQPAKVKVLDKISSDRYTQETGVFLSVFSRNYPKFGFGLGFHTSSGRAPSVYLGPTMRLRGLGEHALLTASAGFATLPVRRFPGIATNSTYPADNPLLDGRVVFRTGGYLLVNLGFSFGPIDNGDSAGK